MEQKSKPILNGEISPAAINRLVADVGDLTRAVNELARQVAALSEPEVP